MSVRGVLKPSQKMKLRKMIDRLTSKKDRLRLDK